MYMIIIGLGIVSLAICILMGLYVEKRQRSFPDELGD